MKPENIIEIHSPLSLRCEKLQQLKSTEEGFEGMKQKLMTLHFSIPDPEPRVFFTHHILCVTRRLHKIVALRGKDKSEEEVTTLMKTDGEEGERGVRTILRLTKAEKKKTN